jgi:HrpA-like RNA helicase
MSNHGGGRAYYDKKVRYRPPNQNGKLSLPARPPKHSIPKNYPFNPGQDLSTIKKRFGAPAPKTQAQTLKGDAPAQALPVYNKRDEIKALVQQHAKVAIVAKTGSGKTTLVPQFLQETGFNVTVVSPRRLAASEVARFGAQIRNEELGESVGFKHALEKSVSNKTTITYATEGYELARQLHNPLPDNEVLIFDECHERTANGALLLAYYLMREAEGFRIPRVVMMSATLGVNKLLEHLGNIPVVNVEGRQFEIKELPRGASPEDDTVRFLREAVNSLSFHYGVKDIEEHIERVREIAPPGSSIFPLHSKLPYQQQQEALEPRKNKAVAATNTAQTSITMDADAVIVTGRIRRLVLDNEGISSLIIDDITQDEFTQQIGRVGRTGPGVYVSHAKPFNELKPHAPSEIQNSPLETLILRVECADIPFRKLARYLIDKPSERHIQHGYSMLQDLGLAGPEEHITKLGRRVGRQPISARLGKLIVKAEDYQKEYGAHILDDAIRIAAVVEAEGILSGDSKNWQRLAPGDRSSDLIKQGIVYHRALSLSPEQRAIFGIEEVNFLRARDIEGMIRRRLQLPEHTSPRASVPTDETQEQRTQRERLDKNTHLWLSRAIIEAHTDSVFRLVGRNEAGDYLYKPVYGDHVAILQKESVVGGAKIIVGTRFNIGYLDGNGHQKIQPLILNAHRVDDLEWLELKTPGHLQHDLKDGVSMAFRPPQKKERGMVSRDFRRGRSFRNGKDNFRKGSW